MEKKILMLHYLFSHILHFPFSPYFFVHVLLVYIKRYYRLDGMSRQSAAISGRFDFNGSVMI
ncbi:MAG: hypothetical protein HY096_01380 [Nitrospinae bacterium]|nr:hypothetical protein [Nitrospinota bacterium]